MRDKEDSEGLIPHDSAPNPLAMFLEQFGSKLRRVLRLEYKQVAVLGTRRKRHSKVSDAVLLNGGRNILGNSFFWINTGYFVIMIASVVAYDLRGGGGRSTSVTTRRARKLREYLPRH
jgi:hypothetical protein